MNTLREDLQRAVAEKEYIRKRHQDQTLEIEKEAIENAREVYQNETSDIYNSKKANHGHFRQAWLAQKDIKNKLLQIEESFN